VASLNKSAGSSHITKKKTYTLSTGSQQRGITFGDNRLSPAGRTSSLKNHIETTEVHSLTLE
jgi:hypothetical protein